MFVDDYCILLYYYVILGFYWVILSIQEGSYRSYESTVYPGFSPVKRGYGFGTCGEYSEQLQGDRLQTTAFHGVPRIRLQLCKPVTWPPLIFGVIAGVCASGNFDWSQARQSANCASTFQIVHHVPHGFHELVHCFQDTLQHRTLLK